MNNHNRIVDQHRPLWAEATEVIVESLIRKVVSAAARYYRWRLAFGIPS